MLHRIPEIVITLTEDEEQLEERSIPEKMSKQIEPDNESDTTIASESPENVDAAEDICSKVMGNVSFAYEDYGEDSGNENGTHNYEGFISEDADTEDLSRENTSSELEDDRSEVHKQKKNFDAGKTMGNV